MRNRILGRSGRSFPVVAFPLYGLLSVHRYWLGVSTAVHSVSAFRPPLLLRIFAVQDDPGRGFGILADMACAADSTVTISVPPADRQAAVLRFLSGDGGHGEGDLPRGSGLAGGASERLPGPGLWEARRGAATVGAAWGRIRPGHTAEVFPPRLAVGEEEATADALLTHLHGLFRAERVRVAYAYLSPLLEAQGRWLGRQGYRHVTDVLLLARPLADVPTTLDSGELAYSPCLSSDLPRLADLLAATQDDTRDFPILNGVLTASDLVTGFAAAGESGMRWWRLVRYQQRDIGCVLLADHPGRQQGELVYLGLVPSVRGRGWGRRLLRSALQLARELGREQMVLAVDAGNDPAIATYAAEAFVVHDQKHVWLQVF